MSEPQPDPFRISRRIGRFLLDRRLLLFLGLLAIALSARAWLAEHPEHDPWAPLNLNDPVGFATANKLAALRGDTFSCRDVLRRSDVALTVLDEAGEGACRRPDRTRLDAYPLTPQSPPTTCDVALALELWQRHTLNPVAQDIFNAKITEIQHLGAYSCRRLYGREEGAWSEHATGNAIDIAGFTLSDGTSISVLRDWDDKGDRGAFLRQVWDGACEVFSTTLSPYYNAAHADHFHLDKASRWSGVCR